MLRAFFLLITTAASCWGFLPHTGVITRRALTGCGQSLLVAESGAEADDATRLLEQAAALRAEVEAAEAEAAADFTKRDEDLSVELFRSLDSNNDGSIDASELQAALAERNILVSEEVVRKVIEKFDLNRDGRLQVHPHHGHPLPTPATFARPSAPAPGAHRDAVHYRNHNPQSTPANAHIRPLSSPTPNSL